MLPQSKRSLGALENYGGPMQTRRQQLQGLCPCRNNEDRDFETWQEMFRLSVKGSRQERNAAAHAIGTLLIMSRKNQQLRDLLVSLTPNLDAVMNEPRAARLLLGSWKKHGHASRGLAQRNYRKLRRRLDMHRPNEVATWINKRFNLSGKRRIDSSNTGIQRLAKWLRHRITFQPERKTTDAELLKEIQRFFPGLSQSEKPA